MAEEVVRKEDEEAEEKPAFRPSVGMLILALIVLVLLVGGYFYYRHASMYESTDDAFIEGTVSPVSSKIAGRVLEVLVEENQEVAAGTPLVKIDAKDSEARVAQAKAELAAAEAKLEVARTAVELTKANTDAALTQANAGVEQAKAAVAAAQSQLDAAKADVGAAESENNRRVADLKRYESVDPRIVSQQQLDTVRNAVQTSQAALENARKRVISAESTVQETQATQAQRTAALAYAKTGPQQVASAQSQVTKEQAGVQQAKAALEAAQLELSYTSIVAPTAGRLARKAVQPGQYVQAGQALMAVVEPEVWVLANFKETQLTRMHAGQSVDVKVDAYPGKSFGGKVQSIQAGTGSRFSLLPPENATGNFVKVVQRVPVKIVFDGAPGDFLLAPGMSVEPHVFIGGDETQHPSPIRVPGPQAKAK